MEPAHEPTITGAQLVADYQATMVNLAGAELSALEAQESEDQAVRDLHSASRGNVLNPSFIPTEAGASIARASLDAHIKKVQAEQIKQLSQEQLQMMSTQAAVKYGGRRVTVTVHDIESKPIESVWFDNRRGYYKGVVRTKQLKGTIKEIWLDRNALLVSPTTTSRIFNPGRKFFIVYIIDPETMQPLVNLAII